MECDRNTNVKDCTCTSEDCPRKGTCCECIAHHRTKGDLPSCLRGIVQD